MPLSSIWHASSLLHVLSHDASLIFQGSFMSAVDQHDTSAATATAALEAAMPSSFQVRLQRKEQYSHQLHFYKLLPGKKKY